MILFTKPASAFAALVLGLALATAAGSASAGQSTAQEILARPPLQPDRHIAYGGDPAQFGELWLPQGSGPHPVVVLIHGGCWQSSLPGLELMNYAADDLRQRGFAVWNLEYRRLGNGGGYPNTFRDVAAGVDKIRELAPKQRLDLAHVVLVGHSAGGDLALWAAARGRLPAGSRLISGAKPLAVAGVVTLGGIDDLETYRRAGPDACGGAATIDALVRGHPPLAKPYADTSAIALLPIGAPQTIVSGEADFIVPPIFAAIYAAKAKAAGDVIEAVTIPRAGHFDLIDPLADAWRRVEPIIAARAR